MIGYCDQRSKPLFFLGGHRRSGRNRKPPHGPFDPAALEPACVEFEPGKLLPALKRQLAHRLLGGTWPVDALIGQLDVL